MDYKRNLTYFDGESSSGALVLIIFGMGCVGSSALVFLLEGEVGALGGLSAFIGIALLIFGIVISNANSAKIMKDQDYEEMIRELIRGNTDEEAYYKLGIDVAEVSEAKPIYIDGYDFKTAEKVKKGFDGKWRSNKYRHVAIYFSENEIHVYTKIINTIKEQKNESTDVYFYEDIVSVSTSSEKEKIFNNTKEIEYEAFRLTTKGGTSLNVAIIDTDDVQRSINAMRSLLRMKKQK